MISTNRILEELQRQLTNAKTTSDEAAMRESIAAMQSLCGLILGGKTPPPQDRDGELEGNSSTQGESPIGRSRAKETYAASVPSGLEGKVLDEEDANGGSLFDF